MSTTQTLPVNNRRHTGDRRLGERRQRSTAVQVERRHAQDRRRAGERRQWDLLALFVLSSQHADRLCSELTKIPADNPISRLLVLQMFLLDQGSRRGDEWIRRWARRLRAIYDEGSRADMCWGVFRALHGDRLAHALGGGRPASARPVSSRERL